MSDTLPDKYKEGIERVSNVVDFVFPFDWQDERRYEDWLKEKWIDKGEYLQAAQEMWTVVHNAIEDYIEEWMEVLPLYNQEVREEIDAGVEYIRSLSIKNIETERYIRDSKDIYQWTCDLLITHNDGRVTLEDWKTWWICQKRWDQISEKKLQKDGLPAIATKKRKKVQLQMSLYAKALKEEEGIIVDEIVLLFLYKDKMRRVVLDIIPDEEINTILTDFIEEKTNTTLNVNILPANTKIDMSDIDSPLKITIQTAPVSYSMAKVEVDLWKLDNWKTAEEVINEACGVHEKIHNYIKGKY